MDAVIIVGALSTSLQRRRFEREMKRVVKPQVQAMVSALKEGRLDEKDIVGMANIALRRAFDTHNVLAASKKLSPVRATRAKQIAAATQQI